MTVVAVDDIVVTVVAVVVVDEVEAIVTVALASGFKC